MDGVLADNPIENQKNPSLIELNVFEAFEFEFEDTAEEEGIGERFLLCDACNGSGEGMYDGTICGACRGKGSL